MTLPRKRHRLLMSMVAIGRRRATSAGQFLRDALTAAAERTRDVSARFQTKADWDPPSRRQKECCSSGHWCSTAVAPVGEPIVMRGRKLGCTAEGGRTSLFAAAGVMTVIDRRRWCRPLAFQMPAHPKKRRLVRHSQLALLIGTSAVCDPEVTCRTVSSKR